MALIDLDRCQGTIEPELLLALAARHRVEGLVASHLLRNPLASHSLRERVEAMRHDSALAALSTASQTARLLELFAGAGIPAILLKGVAISLTLYDDVAERSARDIDILVPKDRAQEAEDILAANGYSAVSYAGLGAGLRATYRDLTHEVEFSAPSGGGLDVELHWSLAPPGSGLSLGYDQILPHTSNLKIGSSDVRIMTPPMALLYVAHHGARHAWFRLKWLADLQRMIAALSPEEAVICRALAEEQGLVTSLVLGVSLVEDLYGVSWPKAFLGLDVPRSRLVRLKRHCLAALARTEDETSLAAVTLGGRLADWIYQLRLGDAGSLRRLWMGDPRDVAVLRLGPSFLWVYRLAAPWLSLARFVANGISGKKPSHT